MTELFRITGLTRHDNLASLLLNRSNRRGESVWVNLEPKPSDFDNCHDRKGRKVRWAKCEHGMTRDLAKRRLTVPDRNLQISRDFTKPSPIAHSDYRA